MIFKINPAEFLRGTVNLPSSKSYSIRAFLIASCGGVSKIQYPSDCDDSLAAISAAESLGASVKKVSENTWEVRRTLAAVKSSSINVKESGTTLRFILPLASLFFKKAIITGEGTLRGRPNKFLLEALRQMGKKIKGAGEAESIPIMISGGELKGGKVSIDGTVSSQFISSLLIAAPLLNEDTMLEVTGKKTVSEEYIEMTIKVLDEAGISISRNGKRAFFMKGRQKFKGLRNFKVPADYGLGAFFMAAGALNKSKITLRGYFDDSFVQADGKILDLLQRMGVKFKKTVSAIEIKGPFEITGGIFSLKDCPDLLPVLSILALFAKGKTRFIDIKHARVKESDRISDLRAELLKIGADVREKEDELIIFPREKYKANSILDPHKDHRLAMAFSILGTRIPLAVKDIECTKKSYPGFVKDLKSLIPKQ
ncbi:MAG: 3-phosphoshikimate 1-carboxyvinyltransferase [Candidatus Omnitrophica bacterium]|nr:3-phosphoshikimate 1-carboxyvinyltransferase [Candidatus Omnitrophota bacterium]